MTTDIYRGTPQALTPGLPLELNEPQINGTMQAVNRKPRNPNSRVRRVRNVSKGSVEKISKPPQNDYLTEQRARRLRRQSKSKNKNLEKSEDNDEEEINRRDSLDLNDSLADSGVLTSREDSVGSASSKDEGIESNGEKDANDAKDTIQEGEDIENIDGEHNEESDVDEGVQSDEETEKPESPGEKPESPGEKPESPGEKPESPGDNAVENEVYGYTEDEFEAETTDDEHPMVENSAPPNLEDIIESDKDEDEPDEKSSNEDEEDNDGYQSDAEEAKSQDDNDVENDRGGKEKDEESIQFYNDGMKMSPKTPQTASGDSVEYEEAQENEENGEDNSSNVNIDGEQEDGNEHIESEHEKNGESELEDEDNPEIESNAVDVEVSESNDNKDEIDESDIENETNEEMGDILSEKEGNEDGTREDNEVDVEASKSDDEMHKEDENEDNERDDNEEDNTNLEESEKYENLIEHDHIENIDEDNKLEENIEENSVPDIQMEPPEENTDTVEDVDNVTNDEIRDNEPTEVPEAPAIAVLPGRYRRKSKARRKSSVIDMDKIAANRKPLYTAPVVLSSQRNSKPRLKSTFGKSKSTADRRARSRRLSASSEPALNADVEITYRSSISLNQESVHEDEETRDTETSVTPVASRPRTAGTKEQGESTPQSRHNISSHRKSSLNKSKAEPVSEVWVPDEDKLYVYTYSSMPRLLQVTRTGKGRVTSTDQWDRDPNSSFRLKRRGGGNPMYDRRVVRGSNFSKHRDDDNLPKWNPYFTNARSLTNTQTSEDFRQELQISRAEFRRRLEERARARRESHGISNLYSSHGREAGRHYMHRNNAHAQTENAYVPLDSKNEEDMVVAALVARTIKDALMEVSREEDAEDERIERLQTAALSAKGRRLRQTENKEDDIKGGSHEREEPEGKEETPEGSVEASRSEPGSPDLKSPRPDDHDNADDLDSENESDVDGDDEGEDDDRIRSALSTPINPDQY